MQEFASEIKRERENRNKEFWFNSIIRKNTGENIYTEFCIWCNCQGKPSDCKSANIFGRWLKSRGIELTFWQRKYIAEKHFGYKYEWNNKQWEIRRNDN